MSTEQNKAVVRRFIEEILTNQNAALVDQLVAPDYVNHLVPGGREGFKQFLPMLSSAFPDLKLDYSVEHLVAEGDYVVVRFTYHVAKDGKEATGSLLSEYRVANGKIVEDWPPSGATALLQQVGVTLPTGLGER
jgi:predicted SnoaL-like aldol condensation-catalyzing enzyme